jgi:single-stranded-DNA-specific exonuclease
LKTKGHWSFPLINGIRGIIGIVAAKLSEKWFKPTAVYSIGNNGLARGSARSIPGVDIFSIFSGFKDIFQDFGGHSAAAGMSIKVDRISEFERLFEKAVMGISGLNTKACLDIDIEVGIDDLGLKTVQELSYLEPFGYSNPAPLFFTSARILNKWILKDKHLKLRLNNGVEAIGFNMAEDAQRIGNTVNIVFKPTLNEWNGRKSLQLNLVDIE